MAIASDGKLRLILCDSCGLQDAGPERRLPIFIDRMKKLGWQFFESDPGWYDTVCPECLKKRGPGKVPEIILGK